MVEALPPFTARSMRTAEQHGFPQGTVMTQPETRCATTDHNVAGCELQ